MSINEKFEARKLYELGKEIERYEDRGYTPETVMRLLGIETDKEYKEAKEYYKIKRNRHEK